MRIERVVADSFGEASERARQRFGSNALVLSTNKVGNVTELLVCVEADEPEMPPSTAAPVFRAALESELAPRKQPADAAAITATAKVTTPIADDGAALVKAIRHELQALEMRLSSNSAVSPLLRERMALLEQGLSAAYMEKLLQHLPDHSAMADVLAADVIAPAMDLAAVAMGAMVVGPAGSGKTTLAMQLGSSTTAVNSLRDTRPGSRERFFAMADQAGIEAGWGSGMASGAIIDSGSMTLSQLREHAMATPGSTMLLALPAHLGRSEAVRWLSAELPIAGVIITHWDDARMPLGVLGAIAESGYKLLAVSDSAQPSNTIRQLVSAADITHGVRLILQLALADSPRVTE
jgi:hypothetical protein